MNTQFRACLRGLALAAGVSGLALSAASAEEVDRLRDLIEPIEAREPLRIGVTLVHLQDDFWKGIAYGIADEAQRTGVEVVQIGVAGAYGNVREQFGQIETLQALGADMIVIGAAAYDGYNPVLSRLREAGITVVAAGIPVNSDNVDFGVGQDDVGIGIAQAEAVCADMDGAPATALMIQGPAGAEWAHMRGQGFKTAAAECDGLEIIEGPPSSSMALEQGIRMTSDLLQLHSDAAYVQTPAVSLGMGAANAIRQRGSDAQVVTSAIVREVIPMVEAGRVLAVASEPGIIMGRLIVQYAIRHNEGLEMPGLTEDAGTAYPAFMVPTTMVTADNAETYPFDIWELPPQDWSIDTLQ